MPLPLMLPDADAYATLSATIRRRQRQRYLRRLPCFCQRLSLSCFHYVMLLFLLRYAIADAASDDAAIIYCCHDAFFAAATPPSIDTSFSVYDF